MVTLISNENYKIVARRGVFETASSAVHSLIFKHDNRDKLDIPVFKDGYVHIKLDRYFGREMEYIFDQETKLKYVLTCLYCYDGKPSLDEFWESYNVSDFIDAFVDYTGTRGIVIDSIGVQDEYGYSDWFFDHQIESGSWDSSDYVVNLYNTEQLIDFIFNPNIGIELNSD